MHSFRVYQLNPAGKIVRGEWIEAADEEEAMQKARDLCDAACPTVELWQGVRRVAELTCP